MVPSICLLLIQLMDTFLCIFPLRFSYLIHCLHQKFISQLLFGKRTNSLRGAIILFAAYSVYACIFHVFSTDFSFLFQGLFHQFFGHIFAIFNLDWSSFTPNLSSFSTCSPSIFRPINTSDTFARWRRHSVYSLFSYWTHLCAFFPRNFRIKILPFNSSHPFARWRHHYICCLYSFLDEFLCVTLRC